MEEFFEDHPLRNIHFKLHVNSPSMYYTMTEDEEGTSVEVGFENTFKIFGQNIGITSILTSYYQQKLMLCSDLAGILDGLNFDTSLTFDSLKQDISHETTIQYRPSPKWKIKGEVITEEDSVSVGAGVKRTI